MEHFTPVRALVGGAMIASSLAIMLVATGRIAGLSGVIASFLRGPSVDWAWRGWFLAGMLGTGLVLAQVRPEMFDTGARVPLWLVAVSGVLVGVGTRLSNGCTSGHGLCGMSRLSTRSIVATLAFFGVGVATATVVGRLL